VSSSSIHSTASSPIPMRTQSPLERRSTGQPTRRRVSQTCVAAHFCHYGQRPGVAAELEFFAQPGAKYRWPWLPPPPLLPDHDALVVPAASDKQCRLLMSEQLYMRYETTTGSIIESGHPPVEEGMRLGSVSYCNVQPAVPSQAAAPARRSARCSKLGMRCLPCMRKTSSAALVWSSPAAVTKRGRRLWPRSTRADQVSSR